jgi:hypothetical protein
MKAAHMYVSGAPWQEIRAALRFRPMYAPRHAGTGDANMGTRPTSLSSVAHRLPGRCVLLGCRSFLLRGLLMLRWCRLVLR